MTFIRKTCIQFILILIANWSQIVAAFQPKYQNGSAVCAVGQSLSLVQGDYRSTNSCVPASVSCAFACQQNAPNCTCFNYYANGSCEFFSGSSVNVSYQQGCTLWAVSRPNLAFFVWCKFNYRILASIEVG